MYSLSRIRIFILLLVFLFTSTTVLYARKKEAEKNRDKTSYLLLEAQRLEQTQSPDSFVVAFEILKKVLKEDDTNQEARYKLTSYYRALNMPEKYYNAVLEAALLDTTNYYYNVEAAENAIKVGDHKQALDIYKRLVKNNPNDENLYLKMSKAYLSIGDIDSAMACYDKIESLTENIEYVALSKAGIYEYLKQYDKEIAELKRLSDAYPENIDYLQYLAMSYISSDSIQKGRELIEKIKSLDSGCTSLITEMEYYKYKQDVDSVKTTMQQVLECPEIAFEAKEEILKDYISYYLQNNDVAELQEADKVFKSLIEQYPREVSLKELYANVLMLLNKYTEAVEQCQSALYIEPDNVDIEKQMIQILFYSGDYNAMNRAIEDLKAKSDSTFVLQASAYYYASKQIDKAIENLEGAANRYSSSQIFLSEIYAYLADIYFNEGVADKAGEYYGLAYKINPNNLMLMNNYAYYLSENGGDLRKAEQMSAKTIKAKPNDPVYLDTYGWIYFKQGNYLFAELYIKRAIENGADRNPEVLEHYGDVLYHQGKTEEALTFWQKALEITPKERVSESLKDKIETKTYIEKR